MRTAGEPARRCGACKPAQVRRLHQCPSDRAYAPLPTTRLPLTMRERGSIAARNFCTAAMVLVPGGRWRRVMGFAFAACPGEPNTDLPRGMCVSATMADRFPIRLIRTRCGSSAAASWLAAINRAAVSASGAAHAARAGHRRRSERDATPHRGCERRATSRHISIRHASSRYASLPRALANREPDRQGARSQQRGPQACAPATGAPASSAAAVVGRENVERLRLP
jgi:hypothetical protein